MASLDEVLSSMEDMGGEEDGALDFLIDENLRVISVPEQGVVLGVEGDKDVNRVRFRMNRYYHQADLSTFDIRINYQNAEGDKNYFEVSEKTATDDSLSFVWTVAADAVSYKGQVCFIVVCLKASAEGTIDKAYHTTIGKASVLEGLTVDEQVDQPKVQDLLLHLKNDLTTHAKGLMENAKTEVKAAAEEASTAADNSAKAAKESETRSATSEANALKSATAASALAQAAKTSETNADSSAKAARTSEANAKKYSERAKVLSNGYKGWYQTEKELAADLTEAKNGDWVIIGESDTIWVWDGDTGAWVDTCKDVDLSNYLTQDQIRKLLEQYMPLRPATTTALGGVKVGSGLSVEADGTLNAEAYTKKESDAAQETLKKEMQTTLQKQISAASAITASGNGYIRFSDGTQICWNTAKLSSSSGNYVFTFPVPFINTTYAVAGFKADRISDTNYNNFCYHTKTTGRVEIDSAYNGYSDKLYSTLIAIGRWK